MKRRNYEVPHTEKGLDLSGIERFQATEFTIHETGSEDLGHWQHEKVISPYWRVIYNLDPGFRVIARQKIFELNMSQLLVIPENVLFDTEGDVFCRHHWIFFSLKSDLVMDVDTPIQLDVDELTRGLFEQLRESKLNKSGPEQLRSIFYLSQSILGLVFSKISFVSHKIYPEKVLTLLTYILQNLGQPLSNQFLADLSRQNVKTFLRWFKKYVGESPTQYITRKRIQKACLELATSNASLDEIAENLGFPNRYYFTRVFTRIMKQGPAKYRKNPSAYLM